MAYPAYCLEPTIVCVYVWVWLCACVHPHVHVWIFYLFSQHDEQAREESKALKRNERWSQKLSFWKRPELFLQKIRKEAAYSIYFGITRQLGELPLAEPGNRSSHNTYPEMESWGHRKVENVWKDQSFRSHGLFQDIEVQTKKNSGKRGYFLGRGCCTYVKMRISRATVTC